LKSGIGIDCRSSISFSKSDHVEFDDLSLTSMWTLSVSKFDEYLIFYILFNERRIGLRNDIDDFLAIEIDQQIRQGSLHFNQHVNRLELCSCRFSVQYSLYVVYNMIVKTI
jgi:hypothetical protein